MSRNNPIGFAFSMVIEIAAVVAIVSFLPRVDLRPAAIAADSSHELTGFGRPTRPEPTVSHVGWTTADGRELSRPPAETSYYERRAAQSFPTSATSSSPPRREPPPLIVTDPRTPGYVEQRLDRASQQLVNSVGSAVAQAADDFMSYQQPAISSQPSFATQPAAPAIGGPQSAFGPAAGVAARRPAAAPTGTTQPRPWIRY
jgi:hypothetical protein